LIEEALFDHRRFFMDCLERSFEEEHSEVLDEKATTSSGAMKTSSEAAGKLSDRSDLTAPILNEGPLRVRLNADPPEGLIQSLGAAPLFCSGPGV
jgi:hypothetical protein